MPTLQWIGKEAVVSHADKVPFRVLERQYSYGNPVETCHGASQSSDNKIIHGDNLEALKALLPQYEDKINCIYIDPPYNTGNENWVYNDNVNSPRIKKWLGQVVGKEAEDLSRHDKWLCMMYPRLKLLQRLLHKDGAIFISIDDNEQANLKLICDEIFGASNFVANISWQRNYSARNDSKGISSEAEHIICYSKYNTWQPNPLPRTSEMDSKYKNIDNDPLGLWRSDNAFAPNAATHQTMVYAIQNPFTGELIYPRNTACWRYQQDTMLEIMNGWCQYELKNLNDEKKRAAVCGIKENEVKKDVCAIVLSKSLEESAKEATMILKRGQWPKYYFTKNGNGSIAKKTYLDTSGGKPPTNLFLHKEVGHTDEAKKEILSIFDGKALFDTPKPTRLINRILQIATDKDSIILDSFAGSGTTAHAVLNLNKADGGNRKFILVEMEDYAETITAERVKRVIDGYGDTPETGGSFDFYELGENVFDENKNLNENIGEDKMREYIWFTETHKTFSLPEENDNGYFLGKFNNCGIWFFYHKETSTTLDDSFLKTMKIKCEQYIIYADNCLLSKDFMKENNIVFKKIPRDVKKL